MANPVLVDCPVDAWTLVATNVLSGTVKILKIDPDAYYETYRVTGETAPTESPGDNDFDGFHFGSLLYISDGSGIDVYIYPKGKAGRVRVDA